MIQFKQVTSEAHQPYTAVKEITMTCCDESTVTEMYEAFEQFMRACGYTVPPEEENNMIADFGNDPYYHEATENDVVNEYLK
jgi:hypothetical protein